MTASPSAAPAVSPVRAIGASVAALAGLNFFLADVRDGLGPFLGVFLVEQGWRADAIGFVMMAGGLAGMVATTPLGMLADAIRAKRAVIAVSALLVVAASLALLLHPTGPVVTLAQIATGLTGAAIGPAIAGLTLGLVGQARLPAQLGRNEAWNHAGNFVAAGLAGLFGYLYGLTAVFVLMSVMAVGSLVMLARIRPWDIDHDVARGLEAGPELHPEPPSLKVLLRSVPLRVLAVTLLLFHFGNAAMLPLLSQQVANSRAFDPAAYAAGTVLIAQLTMVPMALIAARLAQTRGYGLVMVLALVALPVRGLVAGLSVHPLTVLPVQILDGVGAGLLGVATPGIVARILRGTGHVNAGLGAVMTVQGIGAALSPGAAGLVAARLGYASAFLALGAAALLALILWLVMLPRTAAAMAGEPDGAQRASQPVGRSEAM